MCSEPALYITDSGGRDRCVHKWATAADFGGRNASSGVVVREAGDGGVVDDDDDDDDEWDRGIRFFVGVARVWGLETTTDAAPVVCWEQFGERRRRRIGVVGAAKEV